MKLERNINPDGRGKYSLILNRKLDALPDFKRKDAVTLLQTLEDMGVIDHGDTGESAFFVVRLKDENASCALFAYAESAGDNGDDEFAHEVSELAVRATKLTSKKPD